MLSHQRCALHAGMGMGKTSSTLMFLSALHGHTTSHPTLVLGPKRVAEHGWPEEVRKWTQFAHLDVSPVIGGVDKRLRALKRDVAIYSTNYEQLPWLVEHYGARWPFRQVVADESTRLKSYRARQGGKRAAALAKVAHKYVDHFVELTGLCAPNGLIDLYGQAWFLDAGQRLGRTYSAFLERWFVQRINDGGYVDIKPAPHAQAEIQERLRDICYSLDAKDWFDLREPVENVIRVALPAQARKVYREMEREMFTQLQGHDIEAFHAASRSIKCLQMASGFAFIGDSSDGKFVEFHDAKIEALDSVIEEAAGATVLVVYHFKPDLQRLTRAFPGALNLSDEDDLAAAKKGKGRVWLAQPQSVGLGIDGLQDHCHTIAFYGMSWAMEPHAQVIERVGPTRQLQAGFDRAVHIHYIVVEDSVDELVLQRQREKRSVQDLFNDAMKRKGYA